jgi:hypothetical protein
VDNAKISSVSPRKMQLIGIKVYNAAATNNIANTTVTAITFDTVSHSRGFIAPTAATFTTFKVPYTGVYILTANVEWAADVGGRSVWFYINAAEGEGDSRTNDAASFSAKHAPSTTRLLTAGDTVGLRVRQSSGGNLAVTAGATTCSLAATYVGTI